MKKTVLILVMLLIPSFAYAAPFRSITNAKSATDDSTIFSVGSTNVVRTQSINVKDAINSDDVGVLYRATSSGVVDIKITAQTSFKPLNDGSIDADYLDSHVIDASVTDELWNLATIDTLILPYLRFVVTGQGSNDSSTLVEIKVSK